MTRPKSKRASSTVRRGRKAGIRPAICAGLLLLTLTVFWPVLDHDFINYDDTSYVTQNARVRAGLTLEGLRWAVTTRLTSNWHPLTWLSHMLDCELFGLDAGRHHRTSLLLHVLNAWLLFLFLERATAAPWRSGVVAALFAVHPLHVESVAWVSERKDVLSTLFFLLTLLAYLRYARRPGPSRYGLVATCLTLGLLAKPMLVTLPFLLLVLDVWPLGRLGQRSFGRLFREKVPLLALAAASSIVTFTVQHAGKAVESLEQYPLAVRVSNAAVSYAAYVQKMFWPRELAIYYPHAGAELPGRNVALSAALLLGLSALAWLSRRNRPYLLAGWLWFLGTLVPVIGLVQLGDQAMADRYTYVPLIGLFLAVVWGAHDFLERFVPLSGHPAVVVRWLAVAALGVPLILAARVQVGFWRNSSTLFRHALSVTENNHTAHVNLALALVEQDRLDEAIDHLREAVRIKPDHPKAQANLGAALSNRGEAIEAHRHLARAVELEPAYAEAHYNLGISFLRQGAEDEALRSFSRAVEIDPGHAPAHLQCGTLLGRQERWEEATVHLSRAVAILPRHAEAHYNLAVALARTGRYEEAWREVRLAERHGFTPPEAMIRLLREKLPDSGD